MRKVSAVILILSTTIISIFLLRTYNNPSPIVHQLPTASLQKTSEQEIPQASVIADNLEVPWAIAFLPNTTILATERIGRIQHITKNGKKTLLTIIDDVLQEGESGLHGIVIHPNFSTNKYIYVYYTYKRNGNNTANRVARFTFINNTLTNKEIIIDNIPGALFHDGGRIKFGPDGYLYIATGDAQEPSLAQDANSLAGKILRVTDEGKPAPGNPFNTLIFSYGHRNVQGLAWNTDGSLWATEHGRSGIVAGLDELNLIQNGKNYGWPVIQGNETKTDMETPRKNSGSTTWAPSGTAFRNNSLFFAGLKGQTLYEAVIENNQVIKIREHFAKQFGRIREVVVGPDNMLYITTSNRDGRGNPSSADDKIIRINLNKL